MSFHSPHGRTEPRERFTRDGAVIVTPSQLALLQGLMDRPAYRARSRRGWADASQPYLTRFRAYNWWGMMQCTCRVPRSWVTRTRVSGWIQCQLTDRGRDILDRRIRSHVLGFGPYRGMRYLVKRTR